MKDPTGYFSGLKDIKPLEKDDKHGVTNNLSSAWLILGLICLVVFLLFFDQSALSTELDQESSNYMRQLLMLFILPLALLAFLVRHYRYQIAEFWFRWWVPLSLSSVILIWVLPSVLVSLVEYIDANSQFQVSADAPHDLEDAGSSARSEARALEPAVIVNLDATDATIAMQQEIDNSDKKIYWLLLEFGISLTLTGAVLYRLPRQKLSTVAGEEPAPMQQVVDSSSRINIKSSQHYSDVVTLTFHQLVQLAGQQTGVTLGQAVTASEFQFTLQKQGFPEPALQVITRAFEQVRYGHQEPSREQISQVELAISTIHGYLNLDGQDNE